MLNITHYLRNKIKTTVRYHHTPVRMSITKKCTNDKFWLGCGEKATLLHCWWECKLIKPQQEQYGDSFKKLEIKTTIEPTIPLPGMYPEETIISKDTYTLIFIVEPFTVAWKWKHLDDFQQING